MSDRLSDFDKSTRINELKSVIKDAEFMASDIKAVNTHLHTFYSFNIEGISPTEVLYRAKRAGVEVAGTVDFDVLDAMEEVFEVGDILKLRTIASLEARVFVEDYADRDINSPGESGVLYAMGVGFTKLPEAGSNAEKVLTQMRTGVRERNIQLLSRLESTLAPMVLDYVGDVESLTPAGNVTERHLIEALELKSKSMYSGVELHTYWSERLGMTVEEVASMIDDSATLRNTIRAKLMKRGGVGYKQPDSSTFPPLKSMMDMVREMKALPCWAWLDGSSNGEKDATELVEYMVSVGIRSIAIIPERNWNFADEAVKKAKVAALNDIVEAGRRHDMLFVVGTEMNNYGQPFVDDFSAPELAPFVGDFMSGAYAVYGHTILELVASKGMMSDWAAEMFGTDYSSMNKFYAQLGEAAVDPVGAKEKLGSLKDFSNLDAVIAAVK